MPMRTVFAIVAGWTALAVVALASALVVGPRPRAPIPWETIAPAEVVSLALWTVAAAAGLLAAGRIDPPRMTPLRALAARFGCGLPFLLAALWLESRVLGRIAFPGQEGALAALLPGFDARLLGWFALIALLESARYARLHHAGELQAAELEARLARTKLQVLKMQLQPHFLFNTLNTTAELVHIDPRAADLLITRLGDFLRLSLDHAGHMVVPFRQEIDFIRAYVDIEQVRYGERLVVHWECEPDALDGGVPTLIWQPVLENAIRHGRNPSTGAAEIHLGGRVEGAELVLWIRDHGAGLPTGGRPPRESLGLRNTRERIAQLYGDAARFTLSDAEGGGALAMLRIPFQPCAYAHTPAPLKTHELEALLP
ncbi:MAG TPA: histidine kinase [Gemmatimonadales bacterium]|jgi:hypothetical protein|nr:histidine kinase [Gemmatimonadales bacterium]